MTGLPLPLPDAHVSDVRVSDARELAQLVREGDQRAFATLVSSHQPMVFRWALALSGDEDTADDITQETFVRVHSKLSSFRADGSFEGWLYRITRRVALRIRHRTAQRSALAQHATGAPDPYVTDPGARVDRQRAIELIRTVARTLPVRQREVFILCDIEGRTPAEVATMLAMKDVSVRASLFKARTAIRRSILATHPCYTEPPR